MCWYLALNILFICMYISKAAYEILFICQHLYVAIHGVRFNQLAYTVHEDSQLAQLTLVLDISPQSDITVQLSTADRSAIGEYIHI